jgi:hypothetical protein
MSTHRKQISITHVNKIQQCAQWSKDSTEMLTSYVQLVAATENTWHTAVLKTEWNGRYDWKHKNKNVQAIQLRLTYFAYYLLLLCLGWIS